MNPGVRSLFVRYALKYPDREDVCNIFEHLDKISYLTPEMRRALELIVAQIVKRSETFDRKQQTATRSGTVVEKSKTK